MTLEVGARLGPFAIASRLGAGGMGEVYRATDTRLDRSVAIKILPAELAADAQFRLRFERDIRGYLLELTAADQSTLGSSRASE